MRERLSQRRATVLIVGTESEYASRFAVAVRAHVLRHRSLSGGTTKGWRVGPSGSRGGGTGLVWPFRLRPPRLSTLPTIELHCARPDALARTDGSQEGLVPTSELEKVDAFIVLFDSAGAAGSGEWARALVDRLTSRRAASLGGRVAAAAAVLDTRTARPTDRAQEDELRELRALLLAHFAASRVTELALAVDGKAGVDDERCEACAEHVHWALTAVDPLALDPGLAGALSRTPSPAMGWYALVMWAMVVVVPTLPSRLLSVLCTWRGASCAAGARAAVEELHDIDPFILAVAASVTLLTYALAAFFGKTATPDGDARHERRFRRVASSAVLAAWAVALAPRSLLTLALEALSRAGASPSPKLVECALSAMDLRAEMLVIASFLTLSVLATAAIMGHRRPARLHMARREQQQARGS